MMYTFVYVCAGVSLESLSMESGYNLSTGWVGSIILMTWVLGWMKRGRGTAS